MKKPGTTKVRSLMLFVSAMFAASSVVDAQPVQAREIQPYHAQTIQPYQAQAVQAQQPSQQAQVSAARPQAPAVSKADVIPDGGYQTCTLPADRIVVKNGKERPADQAYDNVCLAMLPPTCRNWVMDRQPCAYRNCAVDMRLNKCPDGSITSYVAKNVIPFTAADFAAMDGQIMASAQKLAAQRGAGASTASGQYWQTQINHRQTEAANPDVTYNGR